MSIVITDSRVRYLFNSEIHVMVTVEKSSSVPGARCPLHLSHHQFTGAYSTASFTHRRALQQLSKTHKVIWVKLVSFSEHSIWCRNQLHCCLPFILTHLNQLSHKTFVCSHFLHFLNGFFYSMWYMLMLIINTFVYEYIKLLLSFFSANQYFTQAPTEPAANSWLTTAVILDLKEAGFIVSSSTSTAGVSAFCKNVWAGLYTRIPNQKNTVQCKHCLCRRSCLPLLQFTEMYGLESVRV